MKISTKGHYAVQALVDIALQGENEPVSLSVVAKRQALSQNYLEQLFVKLRKAGLVKSVRGPGGGYLLARDASDMTIGEVFDAVDEGITLTECVEFEGHVSIGCDRSEGCVTQTLWSKLCQHFNELLFSITLADVLHGDLDMIKAGNQGIKTAN